MLQLQLCFDSVNLILITQWSNCCTVKAVNTHFSFSYLFILKLLLPLNLKIYPCNVHQCSHAVFVGWVLRTIKLGIGLAYPIHYCSGPTKAFSLFENCSVVFWAVGQQARPVKNSGKEPVSKNKLSFNQQACETQTLSNASLLQRKIISH